MSAAVYAFWVMPPQAGAINHVLFMSMGLLVYVPQTMIAVMAMNLATRRAAAAAVGLTGIFGYASTVLSGWGIGYVVDAYGWNGAFGVLLSCSIITAALMFLTWNVKPHSH